MNTYIRGLHGYLRSVHGFPNEIDARVTALQRLLVAKGVLTEQEFVDAVKYVEAEEIVRMAFSPEVQAWAERTDRWLLGEEEPGNEEGGEENRP